MVTNPAINRSGHGVTGKPARHRLVFHQRIEFQRRIERSLRGSVGDIFDGPEQAADLRFPLWGGEDSNLRPTDYESAALTD